MKGKNLFVILWASYFHFARAHYLFGPTWSTPTEDDVTNLSKSKHQFGCEEFQYTPFAMEHQLIIRCWSPSAAINSGGIGFGFGFESGNLLNPQLSAIALGIKEERERKLRQDFKHSAGIDNPVPVVVKGLILTCIKDQDKVEDSLKFPRRFLNSSLVQPLLQSATSVGITNCRLTPDVLHPSLFKSVSQLQELTFDGCEMTANALSRLNFLDNPRLWHLALYRTIGLRRIQTGQFLRSNLGALKNLLLKGNPDLEVIESGAFSNLPVLFSLTLADNYLLSTVQPGAFRLPSLAVMDFKFSSIRFLPVSTAGQFDVQPDEGEGQGSTNKVTGSWSLPNMTQLGLHGNKIERVNREFFETMPSLRNLRLDNNQFKSLSPGYFEFGKGGKNLRVLNLARNEIEGPIPSALFSSLPQLEELYLSGNRIGGPFWPWTIIPPSLVQLNLDNNYIVELAPLGSEVSQVNQGRFTKEYALKGLSINKNALTALSSNTFTRYKNLETFSAVNNKIQEILPWTFFGLDNLKMVYLGGNQLVRMSPFALAVNRGVTRTVEGRQWTDPKTGQGTRRVPSFRLYGNPLICDCTLKWLADEFSAQMEKHDVALQNSNLSCTILKRPYEHPDFGHGISCRLVDRIRRRELQLDSLTMSESQPKPASPLPFGSTWDLLRVFEQFHNNYTVWHQFVTDKNFAPRIPDAFKNDPAFEINSIPSDKFVCF